MTEPLDHPTKEAIAAYVHEMGWPNADRLLDPDRVGIALQAIFGGYPIRRLSEGWQEQDAALVREFIRRLRQGVDSDLPAGAGVT